MKERCENENYRKFLIKICYDKFIEMRLYDGTGKLAVANTGERT